MIINILRQRPLPRQNFVVTQRTTTDRSDARALTLLYNDDTAPLAEPLENLEEGGEPHIPSAQDIRLLRAAPSDRLLLGQPGIAPPLHLCLHLRRYASSAGIGRM